MTASPMIVLTASYLTLAVAATPTPGVTAVYAALAVVFVAAQRLASRGR